MYKTRKENIYEQILKQKHIEKIITLLSYLMLFLYVIYISMDQVPDIKAGMYELIINLENLSKNLKRLKNMLQLLQMLQML